MISAQNRPQLLNGSKQFPTWQRYHHLPNEGVDTCHRFKYWQSLQSIDNDLSS